MVGANIGRITITTKYFSCFSTIKIVHLCIFYSVSLPMKKYTSGYRFWTRGQKRGILGLVLCCTLLQVAYFVIDIPTHTTAFSQAQLLSFQERIDSLKSQEQAQKYTLSPFNPNFISDYKAYLLGLSKEEHARLQAFREEGKYVNSAKEFQKVTKVSDSLLTIIAPLFKFPDWVNRKKTNDSYQSKSPEKIIKKDLNTATAEDLLPIRGIGEKLSERIIKYRERLGGFSHKKQLNEVYGLSEEVITEVWKYFDLLTLAQITKLDLNQASKRELAKIPYLGYKEAEALLIFRSEKGNIQSLEELQALGYSPEKIEQLSWYLKVEK